MAYSPTYTTHTIVGDRVKNLSTDLTQGKIEANIDMAESFVDMIMKQTARGASVDFTFDADKHGIIRNLTTNIAAYMCIIYNVEEFTNTSGASLTADLIWSMIEQDIIHLSDQRNVEYLKNL